MSLQDYTPEQALRVLLEKLTAADSALAAQVLTAVNAGKDVQEVEQVAKRKSRRFRHTVPYSAEEALLLALQVLRAHFIEQPLFMNSCHDNMAKSAFGSEERHSPASRSSRRSALSEVGGERIIEIELQTETEIISTGALLAHNRQETLTIGRTSEESIQQQRENFARLTALVDFSES